MTQTLESVSFFSFIPAIGIQTIKNSQTYSISMVTPRRPKIRRKNKKISSSIVDLFKGGLGPSKSIGLILPKAKARKPRKTAKTGSAVRTQSRAKIKRMKMKS